MSPGPALAGSLPAMRRWRGMLILLMLVCAPAASVCAASAWPPAAIAAASTKSASQKTVSHGGKRHKRVPPPPEVALPPVVTGKPSVGVTMPPVGLSFEYSAMAADLGGGACPPPALVSELQSLGSPPLSLAGQSQDMTAPAGALASPAASWEDGTMFSLPPSFWSQLHCLLSEAGDPLTAGLNVKTGNLAWAQSMVAGAESAATNGVSFSLGNEPDLYYLPNYASLGKPQAGEEAASVSLYLQVASYLEQALGGAPLVGPELASAAHWQHELPHVLATLHEQTVGVHMYPLSACVTPKAVTIGGLLSSEAANEPRSLSWVVADADAAQAQAIISEANSASCGGESGISDSPAAAVWAARFVLSALETGFREVRFHFSGDPYDPFVVHGSEVQTRPIEDALAALNQWLPVGSALYPLEAVRGLSESAVGTATGVSLLILGNESGKAQTVVLRTAVGAHVQMLSAASAGLQVVALSATHDRVKLTVPPQSVLAIAPSP